MGTRHLIAVQVDGDYKIAQYGQWDGYPSGQGAEILRWLRAANLGNFANKCRATQWLTDEELDAGWVACGAPPGADMVGMDVFRRHSERWPERSRDCGARILQIVATSPDGIKLRNSISFAADSLFCEYAYVIDLDTKKLEVFRGFNTKGPEKGGRFANLPFEVAHRGDDQYFPVTKLAEFDLSNLPSDAEFLKVCEPEDEEEAEAA